MATRKTSVEDKPKKVNGKAKGNVFERKIAKIMTEWTGIKFERVPESGGLHWKKDNRVYGDIVCNDPDFPFVIECKNREAWNMDSLINGSKEVESWWKQVTKDAGATGKEPMVIFTRNRQPEYVMIHANQFLEIPQLKFDIQDSMDFDLITMVGVTKVHVFKLDEFIERFEIEL